jgi:hypothetical protein
MLIILCWLYVYGSLVFLVKFMVLLRKSAVNLLHVSLLFPSPQHTVYLQLFTKLALRSIALLFFTYYYYYYVILISLSNCVLTWSQILHSIIIINIFVNKFCMHNKIDYIFTLSFYFLKEPRYY